MSAKNLFELAQDGWIQLSPCGEFEHKGAGVTQVLDRASFDAVKASFDEDSRAENFPGVLVDFDHFSLDTDKPSEAAGWITALDSREDGLWAQVRWSDSGLAAVTGGRFRLASPVFPPPEQCEDLGGGRIRPRRLLSVALTNDPNIKGSRPIANRKPDGKKTAPKGDALSGPGSKRFMWILGSVEKGPHCDVCLSRNGKVKTLLEWLRAGAPKCRCKCRLAEVGVEVDEDYVPPVPEPTANRGALSNTGWTDEARAASLAVRRANAADRVSSGAGSGDGKAVTGFSQKYGWLVKDASGWEEYSRVRKEGDTVESMYGFKQVGKDLYIKFNGKWELAGSTDVAGINAFGGLEQNPELGANMRIDGKDALASGKLYRDPMGGRWWMKVGDDWRDLSTGVLMADTLGGGWDLNNRWTDAARAARKTFHGWGDEARTAAAASRAAKRAELQGKVSGGTASPFERLQAILDKPFEDDEKRAPAGYEGPVLSAGVVKEEENPDALYADVDSPSLRDIVGAGPETGNKFLDSVTAGIGAVTLLGGVAVGGGGRGRSTLSSIQKSIARKNARVAAVSRARGGAPAIPAPASGSPSSLTARVCRPLKETVNASRALITSYDLSAVLRQGGILSLSNPGKVPAAMVSMFRSLFSGRTAEQVDAEIRSRPNASLYRQGGLYLSDGPAGALTAREEVFCSDVAKRIPGVAASERAFSAYLNRIRADCFDMMTESLCRRHTPSSVELRAIGNYINVATGRGNLGSLEACGDALSTVFFAPKLTASRFEFLFGMPLTGGTARTRGLIAEQYARVLVGLGVVYGLSHLAGADVGTDPTSSDVGKIRVGEKTRIDILFGLGQSLALVSRMAHGVYTTSSGKKYDMEDPAGRFTQSSVGLKYLRTRLSPLFSANVNLWTGRNVVGEPVRPADALYDLAVPLVARDVAEVYREHQVPTATAEALLALFGAGVAVYRRGGPRDAREEPAPTALDAVFSKRAALQAAAAEEERKAAAVRKPSATSGKRSGSGSRKGVGSGSKKVKEEAMNDVVEMKKIRRKAKKEKALASGGTALVVNRWTDAARAARKTFHGWGDSARTAAAAARARKRAEAGGTYPDGRPAVPDVIGAFDGNTVDPSKSYLSTGDDLAARQAQYSAAFRRWWEGVERTSENIAAFNAFVATVGGAAVAGAGAYRQSSGMSPVEGVSRAVGRAGRYATGREPVYDEAGSLTGFARVGRRPYVRPDNAPLRAPYRRAGRLSADEGVADVVDSATGKKTGSVRYDSPETLPEGFFKGMRGIGPDPFNNPTTPADRAFQASYGKWLDGLNAGRNAALAEDGLDPLGYAAGSGERASTGDAEADRVLDMYGRVKAIVPATDAEADAFGDVMEGLRAYGEMYEADRTERDPGLVDRIAEKLDALERGVYGSAREASPAYAEELPPFEGPDGSATFAHPEEAAEAARALGVLHGSYGAGPEAADKIPESLLEDYVRGLEEGRQGYEYGVVTPADRSGVLRRARAFADGKLGDINDEYEADHIDDKYNAKKFADPAAWAVRNNPDGAVYDPAQPDTRSQYSPQALMESALSWFSDAMVAGDRRAANAALAYMSDLMLGFAGDKAGVYRETLGEGDEDDAEVDTRVPLFDEDGNEIEGDSPFYEDSYADPNARMPWEDAFPFELRNRLFEVYPPLAPLPVLANARWSDAYRARVAARTAASKARSAVSAAKRGYSTVLRDFKAKAREYTKSMRTAYAAEKAACYAEWKKKIDAVLKDPSLTYAEKVAQRKVLIEQRTAEASEILSRRAMAIAPNAVYEAVKVSSPASDFRDSAVGAWKAERARIHAQYLYEKLMAEQDGTEPPAVPAYPLSWLGLDFTNDLPALDYTDRYEEEFPDIPPPPPMDEGTDAAPPSGPVPEDPPEVSSGGSGGVSTPPSREGAGEGGSSDGDPGAGGDTGGPGEGEEPSPEAGGETMTADEEDEEVKKRREAAVQANRRRCRARLANTGWTDAARAASLAVRRAKAEARAGGKAPKDMSGRELVAAGFKAEAVPSQGDNGFAPLSQYDTLIAQAEEAGDRRKARLLRRERNAARKAESRSSRSAGKGLRSSAVAGAVEGAFSEEGPYASAKAKAGIGASDSAKLAGGGGRPYDEAREASAGKKPTRLPKAEAPVRLGGTPVSGAVFYTGDGRLYDKSGKDLGPAPQSVKDGAVFYRGRWFDAKTGRAVAAGPAT